MPTLTAPRPGGATAFDRCRSPILVLIRIAYELSIFFGKEVTRRAAGCADRRSADENLPVVFRLDTLRELADFEVLEDAGLLICEDKIAARTRRDRKPVWFE